MKLFNKKKQKKKQEEKNKKVGDCTIHFKQKHNTPQIKERKKQKKEYPSPRNIVKIKQSKKDNLRIKKVKREKIKQRLINTTTLALGIILILILGYLTVAFVSDLRGGTTVEDIRYDQISIVGFDNIPVYPQSEFVYEDMREKDSVQNMLSKGISVYRLPVNTTSQEVYDYYKQNLPKHGWVKKFRVITSTEDKLFGQYWVQDGKGLRIYVQNNDIWYETISAQEAKTALAERREREIQRQRILEAEGTQRLLPHYPWQLEIPGNYRIKYSEEEKGESVKIAKIGEGKKYYIRPLGKAEEKTFDEYLENFSEKEDLEVTERYTTTEYHHGDEIMHFSLKEGEGILVQNRINYKTYIMYTNTQEDDFFDYVIENIREP